MLSVKCNSVTFGSMPPILVQKCVNFPCHFNFNTWFWKGSLHSAHHTLADMDLQFSVLNYSMQTNATFNCKCCTFRIGQIFTVFAEYDKFWLYFFIPLLNWNMCKLSWQAYCPLQICLLFDKFECNKIWFLTKWGGLGETVSDSLCQGGSGELRIWFWLT